MVAKLLDGQALAAEIQATLRAQLKQRLAESASFDGPSLAVIRVGEDEASRIYVRKKKQACESIGMRCREHVLDAQVDERVLFDLVDELNACCDVHGILVQLPLPPCIDAVEVLRRIDPEKDVDGLHPYNMGCLAQKRPRFRSCTPYGIIELLEHAGIDFFGKEAVIVGASTVVGRPMAMELLLKDATVTVCHRFTRGLAQHVQRADLLIVAIGNPDIIQAQWIKPGAVVVDVGMNRRPNGRVIGDVPFEQACRRAGWITPVPGGVGPMTVAMLQKNLWIAANRSQHDGSVG